MGARKIAVILAGWFMAGSASAADFAAMQKALDIPLSIASVADANSRPGASAAEIPEFILIQDIHRHPEVQANIAAILMHAHLHSDVSTVYLEGAYAGQPIALVPKERIHAELDDGAVSGAEMAAAMVKEGQLRLEGLEDSGVYKENVQAYQQARELQSQALREINTTRLLQETLDMGVSRRLSPEQMDRLELLARLKLKPAEYARYREDHSQECESPALSKSLEAADRFYQLADRRSAIFIERALESPSAGPKAFVVGGFHTAEMAGALRAAGKSFVVLSPHVTRSGYEHLYAERMNETISALQLR